jgi:hypothetical protein
MKHLPGACYYGPRRDFPAISSAMPAPAQRVLRLRSAGALNFQCGVCTSLGSWCGVLPAFRLLTARPTPRAGLL